MLIILNGEQIVEFTSVKTDEAVDHDKQGTSTRGLGQFDAASEAIYIKSAFMNTCAFNTMS